MVYYFLSFYATSSCLILLSLILFLLIAHSISYFSSYTVPLLSSPHPQCSSYPLLLPLILAYFISSHTPTSYPTLSLLFILYHFHSSYRALGCPILILVILFCFLPPHILSYLLCSETVFSLHILYCSRLSFTTFSYPEPSYSRYFLHPLMLYYFLSSYTTSFFLLFGSYTVPLSLLLML